jgi:hypothetical protein
MSFLATLEDLRSRDGPVTMGLAYFGRTYGPSTAQVDTEGSRARAPLARTPKGHWIAQEEQRTTEKLELSAGGNSSYRGMIMMMHWNPIDGPWPGPISQIRLPVGSRKGACCHCPKWEVEACRCSIVGEHAHSGKRDSPGREPSGTHWQPEC